MYLQCLYCLLLSGILSPAELLLFYCWFEIHQHIFQPKPGSSVERLLPDCNEAMGFKMIIFCISYLSCWCGKMPWQRQAEKGRSYLLRFYSRRATARHGRKVLKLDLKTACHIHYREAKGMNACIFLLLGCYGTPNSAGRIQGRSSHVK